MRNSAPSGSLSAMMREGSFSPWACKVVDGCMPSDFVAGTSAGRLLSVAAEFALYETAAAHQSVEAGGKVGTVVVACAR